MYKLIYYSPYRLGSPSFGILLDDALNRLKYNKEIVIIFLTCNGILERCNRNLIGSKINCIKCRIIKNATIERYNHPRLEFKDLSEFNIIDKKEIELQELPKDFVQLKRYTYKEINIGLGIVSSYISEKRNLYPAFNEKQIQLFKELLQTSISLYEMMENVIKLYDPKELVLFNGRFSDLRVIVELASKRNLKYTTLEFETTNNPYKIYKTEFQNCLPHDVNYNVKKMKYLWNDTSKKDRDSNSYEFYQKKRNGVFTDDVVYTANQKQDLIPNTWNFDKINVVIFNSSEDEYAAIGGEWDKNKVFDNQIQGIKWISKHYKPQPQVNITLRIHPNLSKLNYKYTNSVNHELKGLDNLYIIEPESEISSYSLIDMADIIIVFGSTIGIEASYWGKVVINLSEAYYNPLGSVYVPKTKEELFSLLDSKLKPLENTGAKIYGNYFGQEKDVKNKVIDYDYQPINILSKTIKIQKWILGFSMYTKALILLISIANYIKEIITQNNEIFTKEK